MFPVMAVVIQLVWVPAILVCADIGAEIVDEMGPVNYVSAVVVASASIRFSLLPRFSGKSFSWAKGEAVWALEELFT
jgi:hypothetical protein